MRIWLAFLMASLLMGQTVKPAPKSFPAPPGPRLKLPTTQLTPQDTLRAMVAQDQARKAEPGATVEVIGYEEEATLKLIAWHQAEQARLEFRPIDKRGHQELYAFIHQDPSHPSPVLILPALAGGKVARAEDKWLK